MYEEDFDDEQKEIKNKWVNFRVSDKEKMLLQDACQTTGKSASEVFRISLSLYLEKYVYTTK